MPTRPRVSVVVPTCNRVEAIVKCATALLTQTHRADEVIIVDDGSTDDTVAKLEALAADHPELNLKVLVNERNLGANPTRNRGVDAATGAYIAFLDSDCVPEPGWLEGLLDRCTHENVGAVVGLVTDPPPKNVYDLVLAGTCRIPGDGKAARLVGGNMCVRRDLLIRFRMDEDLLNRVDEEGLYLMIKAAGFEQILTPDAVVLHEHYHNRASFYNQAYWSGRSAARLVYKYFLPQRLDLLPFMIGYASVPLIAIAWWLAVVPAFFLLGALAALAYNELCRKGKTIWQTIVSFPHLLLYYHVRLYAYVAESVMLRLTDQGVKRVRLKDVVAP